MVAPGRPPESEAPLRQGEGHQGGEGGGTSTRDGGKGAGERAQSSGGKLFLPCPLPSLCTPSSPRPRARRGGGTKGRERTGQEDATTAESGGTTMLTTTTRDGKRSTMWQEDAATPVTPASGGRSLATDSVGGARPLSAGTAGVSRPSASLPRPERRRLAKTRTPQRRGAGAARRLAAQHAATQAPRPRGTGTASDLTAALTRTPGTDAGLGTPPLLPERGAAHKVRGSSRWDAPPYDQATQR